MVLSASLVCGPLWAALPFRAARKEAIFMHFGGVYVFSEGFASDRRKASRGSTNQNVTGGQGAEIEFAIRRSRCAHMHYNLHINYIYTYI
jgi:hypothetical protein